MYSLNLNIDKERVMYIHPDDATQIPSLAAQREAAERRIAQQQTHPPTSTTDTTKAGSSATLPSPALGQ